MPYIFYNENNEPNLLYAQKIQGIWKLHLFDNKKSYRIPTHEEDNIYECNSTLYFDKSLQKYVLSYMSAHALSGQRYFKALLFKTFDDLLNDINVEHITLQKCEYATLNANYYISSNSKECSYLQVFKNCRI